MFEKTPENAAKIVLSMPLFGIVAILSIMHFFIAPMVHHTHPGANLWPFSMLGIAVFFTTWFVTRKHCYRLLMED